MKRLTSLLSLLFIALSLHVNAATIKEIIQANSNVQILAFENDPTNPYTIVGTDSLQSGGSGVKTLRIKYQADAVVQLTYKEMVSCIISVHGVESFNYNMYFPAGTHELTLDI